MPITIYGNPYSLIVTLLSGHRIVQNTHSVTMERCHKTAAFIYGSFEFALDTAPKEEVCYGKITQGGRSGDGCELRNECLVTQCYPID
jgi:hypothetical protein